MIKERLLPFIKYDIGLLRDDKVRLVPHHTQWCSVFKDEADLIISTLEESSLKLHHCGSTSIPGIVAKPIIDIVGEVKCLRVLDEKKGLLEKLGYEYKGEYGIKGRRYSVLYNHDKTVGYCHLHIFLNESKELAEHILFRNYLIENPKAARRYESLKKSLNVPRNEYSRAKSKVILELLAEAKREIK